MSQYEFDLVVPALLNDVKKIVSGYNYLRKYINFRDIVFIGNNEVFRYLTGNNSFNFKFVNEEDILSKREVDKYIAKLDKDAIKRSGWYLQQFLKISYSKSCSDDYYLVWDADTIPVKKLNFIDEQNKLPYFDMKDEYHKPYFDCMERLMPEIKKVCPKSFITEHMIINTKFMKKVIDRINCSEVSGVCYWQKILRAINESDLKYSGFSEFEMYGTFVSNYFPDAYQYRDWHSTRNVAKYFNFATIKPKDIEWLGQSYDAVSFEKFAAYSEWKNIIARNSIVQCFFPADYIVK